MLDKNGFVKLMDHIHNCVSYRDEESIMSSLDWAQERVEFNSSIIYKLRKSGKQREVMSYINHSYNQEWVDYYIKEGLFNVDPIVQYFAINICYLWSEAYVGNHGKRFHDLINTAKDYGIFLGYSILLKTNFQDEITLISISDNQCRYINEGVYILHSLAPIIHDITKQQKKVDECRLSDREIEILKWIKEGKSNWEIGVILNLSENTIKYHVKNILKKLNVSNRVQAVSRALMVELI